jgi:hypothetical protein
MVTLFRNGGFPMFFILAFGFVALAAAAWYAFRPNPRSFGFILWMAGATLFSTLMGTAADLGATFFYVSGAIEKGAPLWNAALAEGIAESMSPGIMGFALLGMIALVVAVGKGRDPRA